MALKLLPSRKDRVVFISSGDTAVDTSTPELAEEYQKYLTHMDPSRLTYKGEPTKFVCRPMTREILEYALRDARGWHLSPGITDVAVARKILMLCCESIENPPKEAGADLYRAHYGRVGLHPDFVADLEQATCIEAATMLTNTLPMPPAEDEDKPVKKTASIKKK